MGHCTNSDGDLLGDACDNCPSDRNPAQTESTVTLSAAVRALRKAFALEEG